MGVKLTILATSKDGFKVSGSVDAEDFTEAEADYGVLEAFVAKQGWAPDAMAAAAGRVFEKGATPNTSGGSLTCIFDGTTVQGIEVEGKVYSAEQIANGRADKMAKLGQAQVGPVCDDCWKNKGLSAAWKTYYANNKPAYRGRR